MRLERGKRADLARRLTELWPGEEGMYSHLIGPMQGDLLMLYMGHSEWRFIDTVDMVAWTPTPTLESLAWSTGNDVEHGLLVLEEGEEIPREPEATG